MVLLERFWKPALTPNPSAHHDFPPIPYTIHGPLHASRVSWPELNDAHLVALKPVVMKSFERLLKDGRRGNDVRLLFIDYSHSPLQAVQEAHGAETVLVLLTLPLGYELSNCRWWESADSPSTPSLNTGAPQGCVSSPLLYSLYTHNCVTSHRSNMIMKFADGTVVVGVITKNGDKAEVDEVEKLSQWCQANNLLMSARQRKFRMSSAI